MMETKTDINIGALAKLKLIILDDGNIPKMVARVAKQLVYKYRCEVSIGSLLSSSHIAVNLGVAHS
ncbi:hypothetical protein HG263_13060 [Pseudoalteromonas sp. JBTF-M23]|uniref:Uncharacterized protein n=1 Tax=Pseudoalteromonas caenipelagi TaxID=2726988 RepID=A0A849VF82_9GAMM|nr:hypothetical protein [Pseudoalteromonas caenipelagi]NOU51460.1 hypothetical protein [Pseudoalteromonas caenipelagi]